jgi:predicted SprT family Zn-dependent metalloprotease
MDKRKLTQTLNVQAGMIWDSLCEMYPDLTKFDCPKIVLNNRFWRTAGQCHQEKNLIELGAKFFQAQQNRDIMFNVILPHEIIHQADYNLFGDSEKNCGHGENWQKIMVQYGLEPEKHHSMDIKR